MDLSRDNLTAEKLAALADNGTDYGRDPVHAAFLLGRLSAAFDVSDERADAAIPILVARVQARMSTGHGP
jgi:hypothetical protein